MYEQIILEKKDAVGRITLNRPDCLNALNVQLIKELNLALEDCEKDESIRVVVLAGSEKAFAAGADIREMHGYTFPDIYLDDFLANWDNVARFRKPFIAAVQGVALGGGCELAMMCDMIIAAETARFGQPEIRLGIMPGAGGTQRLARAIGKSKTMDLCLTGRMMKADEAERAGLVARVLPAAGFADAVLAIAAEIAGKSPTACMMVKEAVGQSFETLQAAGLTFERRLFQSMFGTEDQKEGMSAYLEKRAPRF